MDFDTEINPQIKIIILIVGIIFLIFGSLYLNTATNKKATNNTIIIYNNSTEIVYVNITPTIDGKTYFAGEYQNGVRLLNHPFSLYWSDSLKNYNLNLSSNKTQTRLSINVYDFAIFDNVFIWNMDKTNSLNPDGWELLPMQDYVNDKILIIFVSVYFDEITSQNSNTVWLPEKEQFIADYNNTQINPLIYPYQMRIAQIQERKTINGDSFIQYYGQRADYTGVKKSESIGGYVSKNQTEIKMGKSNMADGYIAYEIPKNATPEEIKIKLNYFGFGNSAWVLKNPYILND